MMMAPLVRRTWSPCGHTPLLYQKTCSHKKVSAIAAICIAPSRDCLHLFFRLHPDANINAESVESFLKNLLTELQGPVIVIWDRFMPHRSKKIQRFLDDNPRIHMYHFPPYAPELNPVESIWAYAKMNPMANMAAMNVGTLTNNTRRSMRSIQLKQPLLRSFMRGSGLSLRLK
jgi:DDE superfamily endonuclease